MKLPSLKSSFEDIKIGVARFPFTIVIAVFVSIFAIYQEHLRYELSDLFMPEGFFCLLAYPLSFAVVVFAELHGFSRLKKYFSLMLVFAVLLLYYFVSLKGAADFNSYQEFFYYLNMVMAWALVLIIPITKHKFEHGFWHYSIRLLTRVAQAMLFMGILFLGLLIFMEVFKELFDIKLSYHYSFDIWVIVTAIIGTLYVLAGIPHDLLKLQKTDFDSGFYRGILYYLFLPLLFLYLLLLYVYAAKILLFWDWPKGEVATITMGFSAFGVVLYFLINRFKGRAFGYVEFFKKWFFPLLLPLIFVLFIAIGMRLSEYGFTIERYFVLIYGVWLLLMSIYYILSRRRDLRVLGVTAFVVLLFTTYGGPFNAVEVSRKSQVNRAVEFLEEYGAFVDGKVVQIEKVVLTNEDYNNLRSIFLYLDRNYGREEVWKLFTGDLSEFEDKGFGYRFHNSLMEYIGFDYEREAGWGHSFVIKNDAFCHKYADCPINPINVEGYDYYAFVSRNGGGANYVNFGNKEYIVQIHENILHFRDLDWVDLFTIDLESFVEEHVFENKEQFVSNDLMIFVENVGGLDLKIVLDHFYVNVKDNKFDHVYNVDYHLFLKE